MVCSWKGNEMLHDARVIAAHREIGGPKYTLYACGTVVRESPEDFAAVVAWEELPYFIGMDFRMAIDKKRGSVH